MFILRKISGSGVEMNFNLGDSYTLITKEHNKKEFKEMAEKNKAMQDPIIYGFVAYDNGKLLYLSSQQENYIMTENGGTFANVCLK